MKKRNRNYRKWLEPASTGTDSYVQVSQDDDWIDLTIADCGRRVGLSFTVYQNKQMKVAEFNRLKKIKLQKVGRLEEALVAIREAVEGIEFEEQTEE